MPTTTDVVWKPQPGSQIAFLTCPVFEVLYEGTRGPGKTDALLMDFCQHVGLGYGQAWKGVLFRQTYKQLTDVISKSKKWIPAIWPTAKYNNTEHTWTFPGGEQLLLRQFKHDDDYYNYHGHEYPWIAWEEICNWPADTGYRRMMSCCRSSTKGMPRKYRATGNPYGPGHNWVKFRFNLSGIPPIGASPVITGTYDADGDLEEPRVSIHGDITENLALLEADPGYIVRLKGAARNDAELRAWTKGDWDIVAGGMFDDVWDQRIHVLKPFPIPHSWRIDRSFDWGSSAPFSVGWWAQSDGSDVYLPGGKVMSTVRGDLFRIAEWYGWTGQPNEGSRMLASQVSYGIVERQLKWSLHKRVKAGPADTQIYAVEDGQSIAKSMEAAIRIKGKRYPGVRWTRADKRPGSRKTGWELMRKALEDAKVPELGPRESPGLFIFSNCVQFMRTVPVLPRDEDDMDDVDTDAEDHIADETRYRVRFMKRRVGETHHVGMF